MRYLLALLILVGLAPAADQKPLVINPTTGKQEQLQPGNNLAIPDASGDLLTIGTGVQTAARTLTVPVLTGNATLMTLEETQTVTGAKTFSADITASGDILVGASSGNLYSIQARANGGTNIIGIGGGANCKVQGFTAAYAASTLYLQPLGGNLEIGNGTGISTFTSTTDATSKDAASVVLEGGLGVEKAVNIGTTLTVGTTLGVSGLSYLSGNIFVGSSSVQIGTPQHTGVGDAINFRMWNGSSDVIGLQLLKDSTLNGIDVLANTGNIYISTVGKGLYLKEGANAKMGVATLSGGTVTVNTTAVTANSRIYLTGQTLGTVVIPSNYGVSARVAATSFTILASQPTDTSDVAWMIVEPAP